MYSANSALDNRLKILNYLYFSNDLWYPNTGWKQVEKWDENLLLQRLCEAFKKAKDGGQKHVTVCDLNEQMECLELGAVLEILKNQGEKRYSNITR